MSTPTYFLTIQTLFIRDERELNFHSHSLHSCSFIPIPFPIYMPHNKSRQETQSTAAFLKPSTASSGATAANGEATGGLEV
jgi:hypothetical protein